MPAVPTLSESEQRSGEWLAPGSYSMVAVHLGSRINLDETAKKFGHQVEDSTKNELTVKVQESGRAYIFGHGSAVLLNVGAEERQELLAEVERFVVGETGPALTDEYALEYRPGAEERVEFGRVVIAALSHKKVRLVAQILAQSTSLERFEMRADQLLERAAEITDIMATEGKVPRASKDLLRFIGVGLSTRRKIVSQLSLIDPPEEIWDDVGLDTLYHALRSNFDLQVRFRALEYKLELIEEAVEVVTDLHDSRRGYILEIIVIILIAVEVLVAFFGHH